MWSGWKEAYSGAFRFMFACPMLALIPFSAELAQHLVEFAMGMFDSRTAAMAVARDPARIAAGAVKVMAVMLPGYWVTRFLAYRLSPIEARHWVPVALRLFAIVIAFRLAVAILQLTASQTVGAAGHADLTALFAATSLMAALILMDRSLLLGWYFGAPLGNASLGIGASVALMRGRWFWTPAFCIVGSAPLLLAHALLNHLAVGKPAGLAWSLLALDALVTAYLAALLAALNFVAVERAIRAKGLSLFP